MAKRVYGDIFGCWIPIVYDGQKKHRTVTCSECQESFRYAHDKCPACGIRMMFDPTLVYGKEEEKE